MFRDLLNVCLRRTVDRPSWGQDPMVSSRRLVWSHPGIWECTPGHVAPRQIAGLRCFQCHPIPCSQKYKQRHKQKLRQHHHHSHTHTKIRVKLKQVTSVQFSSQLNKPSSSAPCEIPDGGVQFRPVQVKVDGWNVPPKQKRTPLISWSKRGTNGEGKGKPWWNPNIQIPPNEEPRWFWRGSMPT